MTTGQTSTINIGQLALDMYDSAHHDLVWRGVASKTLDTKAKPDKREKNLRKAAAKLLKNYPPVSLGSQRSRLHSTVLGRSMSSGAPACQQRSREIGSQCQLVQQRLSRVSNPSVNQP